MATRMNATASVRRVLPRAFARICLGSSPCIGGYNGFQRPPPAERQAEDALAQARRSRLLNLPNHSHSKDFQNSGRCDSIAQSYYRLSPAGFRPGGQLAMACRPAGEIFDAITANTP